MPTTQSRKRGKICRTINSHNPRNATHECVLISVSQAFALRRQQYRTCPVYTLAALQLKSIYQTQSVTCFPAISNLNSWSHTRWLFSVYSVKSLAAAKICVIHWHNSFVGQQIRPIESRVKGHFVYFTHLVFLWSSLFLIYEFIPLKKRTDSNIE